MNTFRYTTTKWTRVSRAPLALALCLTLASYGCGDDTGVDPGNGEGNVDPDVGSLGDSSLGDTGGTDTATGTDAGSATEDGSSGTVDTGSTDGGTTTTDGGTTTDDGGTTTDDGGTTTDDGGSTDAGSDDGGSTGSDAGTTVDYEHSCNPCQKNDECKDANVAGAACVVQSKAIGAYCAAPCGTGDACGADEVCKELEDVDGTKAKFCIPKDDKQCTCSKAAVDKGMTTVCSVTSDINGTPATCSGTRKCEAAGLSACDAQTPAQEKCDGVDNDCNSKIDEAKDCDDNNVCTDDTCAGKDGCKNAPNKATCDDNDPCSEGDACKEGKCAAAPKNCDDKNACTNDSCDAKKGCVNTNLSDSPCEDGNGCTANDKCKDGACVAGDLTSCDDGNACTKNACAVDTGKCATVTVADGTGCDDNNKCTKDDACAVGICTSATQVDCDDGNGCTADSCAPATGCTATNDDSASCDDNDACTSSSNCSGGACKGANPVNCDDKNPCTADSCDAKDGKCLNKAAPGKCDDGDKCTEKTACAAGKCVGSAVKCDDNNACTDDKCDSDQGCQTTNNADKCKDGNPCTTGDICKDGTCAGKLDAKACDDENDCTKDSCDPTNGCQYANDDGAKCDDGDACSENDSCKSGKCAPGKDVCQCQSNKDCKDDGNLCNGTPVCKSNKCVIDPSTVVKCDTSKDTDCRKTSCDVSEGQCKTKTAADGKDCDDGKLCSTDSNCKKGICTAIQNKNCDDSNPCTADSCNPIGGKCVHKALPDCKFCKTDKECNNGDACADSCVASKCEYVDKNVCAKLPDYTVTGLALGQKGAAIAGRTFKLSHVIANLGHQVGTAAPAHGLYLSSDAKFSAGDLPLKLYGSLKKVAGKNVWTRVGYTVIPANVKAGKYFLLLGTDPAEKVKEQKEDNNWRAVALTVIRVADLWIPTLTSKSSAYKPETVMGLSFSVRNSGTANAGAHKVGFWLSKNSSGSIAKDDILVKSLTSTGLTAGKTVNASTSFKLPKAAGEGTWYIKGWIDYEKKVTEVSDSNNWRFFKFVIAKDKPANLKAGPIAIPKKTYVPGSSVSASWSVSNTGGKTASGYKITFYIGTSSKLPIGLKALRTISGPTVGAGKSAKGTTSLTLPTSLTKKTWYIWARFDSANNVAEGSETDNWATAPVVISTNGPDLRLQAYKLGLPAYKLNQKIGIVASTRNYGGITAGTHGDRIYLSADTKLGNDKQIYAAKRLPIAAGKWKTHSINATIPAGTKAGTYYVIYVVDADKNVGEYNENNNVTVAKVVLLPNTAKPDLEAKTFATVDKAGKAKTAFAPGQAVYVSNKTIVRNPTLLNAGAYTDAYVGSTNSFISTADPVIKTIARKGLGYGKSYSAATSFTLPWNLKKGTYYLALYTDRYNKVSESNEGNNRPYAKITVTANGVDLTSTKLTVSKTTVKQGESITIAYTRRNIGGVTSPGFRDGYYLSSNTTWDSKDTLLKQYDRGPLGAGKTVSGSIGWAVPKTLKPGTYYVLYVQDTLKKVAELSESNNVRAVKVSVISANAAPDLTTFIGSVSAKLPGQKFTLPVQASNKGLVPSKAFKVDVYVSTNSIISTSDIWLGTASFSGLAAGKSATANVSVTLPTSLLKKNYYLGAWADRANAVAEANESNNKYARVFAVSANGANLEVTSLLPPKSRWDVKTNSFKYRAGDVFSATSAHKNSGGISTGKGYKIGLYLSTNTAASSSEKRWEYSYTTALGAGSTRNRNGAFTIPTSTKPGTWYVGFWADNGNVIKETSESNIKWVKLTIDPPLSLPDLTISSFKTTKTSYKPGERVYFSASEYNKGKAGAGAHYIGYYWSTNSIISTGDTYLGRKYVSSLAAGKVLPLSTSHYMTLPTNLKKGQTVYVGLYADYGKKITEASETNQYRAQKVTVSTNGIDLQPTSVKVSSATVQAGKSITFTMNVKNNGGITSGSHYNAVYLSTDSAITSKDTYLGRVYDSTHAAGSTETKNFTVTIKSTLKPGTYYLGTRVDYLNYRKEYNEGNNTSAGVKITVTAPPKFPDLAVTALLASSSSTSYKKVTSVKPGQVIYLWTYLKNQGNGTAVGKHRTGYYVSTNTTITTGDQYVTNYYYSSTIAAGKTVVLKRSFVVPTNLTKKTYYFGAIADYSGNIVKESNEKNNTRYVALTVNATGVDYWPSYLKTTKALYKAGEKPTMQYRRSNNGETNGGTAYDAFYLSTNTSYGSGDVYLGRKLLAGQKAKTSSSTQTFTATTAIPTKTKPGTYYILVRVNYANQVKETSTVNNVRAYRITVTSTTGTADLRPYNLYVRNSSGTSTLSSAKPGDTVRIYVSTKNYGNKASGTYLDGFYGSTSSSTSSLGSYWGNLTRSSLNPNAASTYYKTVKIPTNLRKGSYYVKVFNDYNAKITELSETNNRRVRSLPMSVDGADLQPTSVATYLGSTPRTTFKRGETVSIRYIRRNNGGISITSGTQEMRASTNTIYSTGDTLITTFSGGTVAAGKTVSGTRSWKIPSNYPTGTYYIGYKVDSKNTVKEYNESNNLRWSAKITITSAAGKPDLRADSLTMTDYTVNPLQGIIARSVIKNVGSGAVGKTWRIGYYISTNSTITTGDTYLEYQALSSINAGATSTWNEGITIPTNLAKGTYYLGIIADYNKQVSEVSESNNTRAVKFTTNVNGRDLSPSTFYATKVAHLPGGVVQTIGYIKNTGGITSTSHRATVYLSTNSTYGSGDIALANTSTFGALAVGKSQYAPLKVTIPKSTKAGTYYLIIRADSTNANKEYNESNNYRAYKITVTSASGLPDYDPTGLTSSTYSWKPGDTRTVRPYVKNIGTKTAPARRDYYYWSTNSTISTADTYLEYYYRSASINVNSTDTYSNAIKVPTNLKKGTYYIGVFSDANKAVSEVNENNNTYARKITITVDGLDMTPTVFTTTGSSFKAGQWLSFKSTLKNAGGISAGSNTARYYLSTNSVISTGDTYLGRAYTSSYTAGQSKAYNSTLRIPESTKPGTYYVGVLTDYSNALKEHNESNNYRAVKITVTAGNKDLASYATPYSFDITVDPGQTVKMRAYARNYGTLASGSFRIGYYVSTNTTISKSDTLVATYDNGSLASGAQVYRDRYIKIPTNVTKGQKLYLGVCHDILSKVAESSETNNCRYYRTVTVNKNGIDLQPTAMTTTATKYMAGKTVSFNFKIKNNGATNSGSATARLYLSTNSTISTSDTYLGKAYTTSYTAGQTKSYSSSFKLSTSLKAGTYYVGVVSDYSNAQKEYSETNNTRGYKITVTKAQPDIRLYRTAVVSPVSSKYGPGDQVTVYLYLENIGTLSTGSFDVTWFGSTNSTISGSDTNLGKSATSSLSAGAKRTISKKVTLPINVGADSTYYLGGYADIANKVAEPSTANNNDYAKVINFTEARPDLKADYLYVYQSGSTSVRIRYRRRNEGTASALTGYYDRYWLSSKADCSDNKKSLKEYSRSTLAAGKCYPSNCGSYTTLYLTKGTGAGKVPKGTWYFCYKVDSKDKYKEYDEKDNVRSYKRTIN